MVFDYRDNHRSDQFNIYFRKFDFHNRILLCCSQRFLRNSEYSDYHHNSISQFNGQYQRWNLPNMLQYRSGNIYSYRKWRIRFLQLFMVYERIIHRSDHPNFYTR